MGYRLDIYRTEHIACGGKLFGYINEEDLPKCKSWVWLLEHNKIYEDEKWSWTYGFDHVAMLYADEYKEFMKLYIEDYVQYGYNNPETIEELTNSLNCNDDDIMVIEWG